MNIPETHQRGRLTIENLEIHQELGWLNVDLGIQIHHDGRIWLCIEGVAFVRFTPHQKLPRPASRMFWHPGRLRNSIEIVGKPGSTERLAMIPQLNQVCFDSKVDAAEMAELVLTYTNLQGPPV